RDRDRLTLVQGVREAAADFHVADDPPLLGQAIERDAAPGTGVTRRRLTGSGRLPGAVDLLPLEEVERHASVLGLPALGADRLDHVRVGERRRIAKSALFGDVAQQAAHDLAGAGLG